MPKGIAFPTSDPLHQSGKEKGKGTGNPRHMNAEHRGGEDAAGEDFRVSFNIARCDTASHGVSIEKEREARKVFFRDFLYKKIKILHILRIKILCVDFMRIFYFAEGTTMSSLVIGQHMVAVP